MLTTLSVRTLLLVWMIWVEFTCSLKKELRLLHCLLPLPISCRTMWEWNQQWRRSVHVFSSLVPHSSRKESAWSLLCSARGQYNQLEFVLEKVMSIHWKTSSWRKCQVAECRRKFYLQDHKLYLIWFLTFSNIQKEIASEALGFLFIETSCWKESLLFQSLARYLALV